MAGKKRSYKSSAPDPVNGIIDLLGAVAYGMIIKHRVKKDYERGCGPSSAAAATFVASHEAMKKGGEGLMGLGGLYGISSALKDVEREQNRKKALKRKIYDDSISVSYPANDNRFAWRLDCVDGSAYGIDPNNYSTRDEYNAAIKKASAEEPTERTDNIKTTTENVELEVYNFCKVSIISTGENQYYLIGKKNVNIGDTVLVPLSNGVTEKAVVLTVERHTKITAPSDPERTMSIL